MHLHIELSSVDEFKLVSSFHYLQTKDSTLYIFGACSNRGRRLYTITAPSVPFLHRTATCQSHIKP